MLCIAAFAAASAEVSAQVGCAKGTYFWGTFQETEMDRTLMRAITKIWSKESMRHAAGRDESKACRPKTSNMERVWEEIASSEQVTWLKNITEGGARMLWDGRIHREFISGIRRFGATNGKAKKTQNNYWKKSQNTR